MKPSAKLPTTIAAARLLDSQRALANADADSIHREMGGNLALLAEHVAARDALDRLVMGPVGPWRASKRANLVDADGHVIARVGDKRLAKRMARACNEARQQRRRELAARERTAWAAYLATVPPKPGRISIGDVVLEVDDIYRVRPADLADAFIRAAQNTMASYGVVLGRTLADEQPSGRAT